MCGLNAGLTSTGAVSGPVMVTEAIRRQIAGRSQTRRGLPDIVRACAPSLGPGAASAESRSA